MQPHALIISGCPAPQARTILIFLCVHLYVWGGIDMIAATGQSNCRLMHA